MLLAVNWRAVTPLVTSRFREDMARISPNGKWVAYRSDESGRSEIYVRGLDAGGRKWLVSTDGGSEPEWRQDGKELFYLRGNAVTAVDVSTAGAEFDAGKPKALFEKMIADPRRNRYLASPDGQQFLVVLPPEDQASSAIQVIIH